MTMAHEMRKGDKSLSWSDCCRLAIQKTKLKRQMSCGTIDIRFTKKSTGELREAKATTVTNEQRNEGTTKKANVFIINFIDAMLNEWRSCDVRTLV